MGLLSGFRIFESSWDWGLGVVVVGELSLGFWLGEFGGLEVRYMYRVLDELSSLLLSLP